MTISTGSQAPVFDLPTVVGDQEWHLNEALGRGPVVIGIYKSSCGASKVAIPVLQKMYEAYPEDQVSIVGVALDSPNITASFARRYELSLPLLIEDEDYPTSQAYGVSETPTIFLIDPSGTVVWQATGFDKSAVDQLSQEIGRLLRIPAADVTSDVSDLPAHVPG